MLNQHLLKLIIFSLFIYAPSAKAAECLNDKITRVTGKNECLAIHTFVKNSESKIKNLVIFIHGDQSDGKPVRSMIDNAEATTVPSGTVKVSILRPGYQGGGRDSTGDRCGVRGWCYGVKNVNEMTAAIQSLKDYYKPLKTIIIGHSGGATITGVMIGRTPGIAEGAILLACNCNISQRLVDRNITKNTQEILSNELSPSDFVKNIPKTTKVIAITGAGDNNTRDVIAKDYIKSLIDLNISAQFKSSQSQFEGHEQINIPIYIEEALNELLK